MVTLAPGLHLISHWSVFVMFSSGLKLTRVQLVGVAIATALTVGVTANEALSQSSRVIDIDGSSTVFPITEAVAEEFMAANNGIDVTVGVSGTGGGFRKFCAGEIDVANASRKIKDAEIAECTAKGIQYVEIPVAFDALTVVVNRTNTWVGSLTVQQLKMMWEPSAEGRITRWNQINPSWPNEPISLYGPGTDSGTFDYFTAAIVGEEDASRADYTASEDDNVLVLGVSRNRYALGYFGMAYYLENQDRLRAVPIDNGRGPVSPTPENVNNGNYKPLSRKIYIYVNKATMNSEPQLRAFAEFYIQNAGRLSSEVGYVALPAAEYNVSLLD
jgi:phosphate transport system substrate-binding protein